MAHPEVEPDSEAIVAGYRIERRLRRRSRVDVIHEAVDTDSGRRVELRLFSGRRPEPRERFESGAALLGALQHPNLPEVYAAGEADEGLYVASARVEGETLAAQTRGGGLPPLRALRLLGGVADALDEAHAEELVHGDVRLETVIVAERHGPHPFLVDFAFEGTASADVRDFAGALRACLADGEVPAELGKLLASANSGKAGSPGTAGDLVAEASRIVLANAGSAARPALPAARPARAAAAAPTQAPRRRRLSFLASPRVPLLAALALVAGAGAGGFLAGRPSDGEPEPATLGSGNDVQFSLPAGWSAASGVPPLPGPKLNNSIAAGLNGRAAFVAARLPRVEGGVYLGKVARRMDRRPPQPRAVRLDHYEGLRFQGIDLPVAGAAGSSAARDATLFVVPTSAGTLAAVCLGGVPRRDCESAAASLRLPGAAPSGVAAGERFVFQLDLVLRRLASRRSRELRRLRSADTSRGQARAARELAGAYAATRRSVARLEAPPAADPGRGRLAASLADLRRGYDRLAGAAGRRKGRAYAAARGSVRRAEGRLRVLLRRL